MGRGLHTVLVLHRAPPTSLVRALLWHAGVGSPCGRDPRGSRRLGALGRAVCRSSRIPPPPRRGPFWGRGGVSSAPGGQRAAPVASKLEGGSGGGGAGGPPPRPPAPPAIRCLRRAPPGYTRAVGVAGRPRASGAVRSAANGSVRRGGGGGNPPALVRAPFFPGPASDRAAPFAPSWAPPVCRRPAAGRACRRLPRPWCTRTPGAAAFFGGVPGRRFFGLPPSALQPEWEGGVGEWVGPSGPLAPPPDGQGGGGHGRPGPGGQPSAGRSHPSPTPLYLEPDPRAGPRWGPSSPPPSWRGAGRLGASVMVSGQRLAGCGAAGSPPRSLSLPSLPRVVARAPSSRRTVGGAWVGGPSSPPHLPPQSPAPPLVWGLGLWRRRVAPTVAPVGEGAAQGPGEPVVGVRIRDAEYRFPFQAGRPRWLPVGPRRPDH